MFIAKQVALALIQALRTLLEDLQRHDRDLVDQLRRAATSVLLNVAEGGRRVGKDRLHFSRIAAGSAAEVGAALEVAIAWHFIDEAAAADAQRLVDRQLGLLWGLTRPRR